MSHVPRHATLYVVDVPDEDSARDVARVLAGRGHTVVRAAPRPPGDDAWWRVAALDEGPYPDDDEPWWTTVEQRTVSALSRGVGGHCTVSHAIPETARRFLPDGEDLWNRTVAQVRGLRAAAFSWEAARAPAPAVVHRLAHPEPSDGPTGEPIALEGLDDVDWASLSDAYDTAGDTPDLLRRLAANDEDWDDAVFDFFSAIVHQDTCYTATPHAVGFLVQLARAPELTPEYRRDLLVDLAYIAGLDPSPAAGGATGSTAAAACQAVMDGIPDLLALWPDVPATERAWLIVLAAFAPEAAADLLRAFRGFRRGVEGPSPALDLALALVAGDGEAVLGLTLDAASRDERVPPMLEAPAPLRARQLRVLVHLAIEELAPRVSGPGSRVGGSPGTP